MQARRRGRRKDSEKRLFASLEKDSKKQGSSFFFIASKIRKSKKAKSFREKRGNFLRALKSGNVFKGGV